MKLIKETLSFERKRNPKETLIGDKYTEENLKKFWEFLDEEIKTLDVEYQNKRKVLSAVYDIIRDTAFQEHHDIKKAFDDHIFFNFRNKDEGAKAVREYMLKKLGIKV